MKIKLAYGRDGLTIEVPEKNLLKVLEIKETPAVKNLSQAVRRGLERPRGSLPLTELAAGRVKAVVVVSDSTRPVPYREILPEILNCLIKSGLRKENIIILIATGIHRPMTKEEINNSFGQEIARQYRVANHFSQRKSGHIYLGRTKRGAPIFIDRLYMKADLKIITGLIEPHLLAGYSGGRKAICPGLVSIETIHFAHGHRIIDHPKATIGLLQGNPLHEEALFMARKAGVDFCLNVTINKEKKVTGVFAGNFEKAHDEGVKFLNRFNRIPVPEKPDIIITTAGGVPLDNTFYQSIKGPNSIKRIIKKGGVIILASACCEGVGSAEFRELLLEAKSVDQIMARIRKSNFFRIDQWMVQHLCHVLERAEVYFYSHNLKPELIRGLLVKPISSVEEGIKLALKRIGSKAGILVIPDGPYVIPFLR